MKVIGSSADASRASLRSRVVWIALLGMTMTVAALAVITAVLLFTTVRTLTDEEMSRQLESLTEQFRGATAGDSVASVNEAVEAVASSQFTVVALDADGGITTTSGGPKSIREALTGEPTALSAVELTTTALPVQVGDSSLRYVAAEAPDGSRVVVLVSSDDIRDRAVKSAAVAAGVGMLCVVVGAVATSRALTRAIRPLTRLTDQTRQLGSDAQQRVDVATGPAEVHELAEQLNALLDRIEAEQRRRTTFLATVSHEVRTPLAIARGHLEAHARYGSAACGDDPAAAPHRDDSDSLAVAAKEIARAGRMVESLLTLTRAEEPGFVHRREVALRAFAEDLNLRLAGLDVAVAVAPPPDCRVVIDTERLAQATLNAVTNSMVHNDDAVRVKVSWIVSGVDLTVVIDDDGAGFPPLPVAELVQPFVQGSPGSSGLGLAVIDTIARGHQGSLELGESPAGGARVVILLPGVVVV